MAARRAPRALGALLAAAALLACGGGGGGGATTVVPSADAAAQQAGGARPDPARVRLALAPDPIWEWLKDSGAAARWEADRNVRIVASNPFDPFAAFAGGHADVVVINALDVPQFVAQSGREPVIVGKLATDRSIVAVRRTSRAETLDDLVEARITVDGSLGSALLWGLIAEAVHGLDFRVGGADFDLVVVEAASAADLVMRGDVDACVCVPDFSVSGLAGGRLRPLYGGRSAAEVYAQEVAGDPGALPVAEALVADGQWLAQNRGAADALLGLWEAGLRNWASGKERLVADYPHLFSVQTDEEVAWMADYVAAHDWAAPSPYLTPQDSTTHADIFARMRSIGLVADDAAEPELDLSHAAAP